MKSVRLYLIVAITSFTTIAHAGMYDPTRVWKNRTSLSICFASSLSELKDTEYDTIPWRDDQGQYHDEDFSKIKFFEFDSEYRLNIQKAVQSTFTPAKTGIEFTGFKSCIEDPTAEVVLFWTNDGEDTMASSLPNWPLVNNKSVNYKRRSIRLHNGLFTPSQYHHKKIFEILALEPGTNPEGIEANKIRERYQYFMLAHELGHTLGLRHEHERDDGDTANRSADLTPNNMQSDLFARMIKIQKKENNYANTHRKIGPYSIFSAMNYVYKEFYFTSRRTQVICDYLKGMDGRKILRDDERDVLIPIWQSMKKYEETINPPPLVPGFDPGVLSSWMCDDTRYLELIPPPPSEGKSYLDRSDEETLAFIYAKRPLKNAWLKRQDNLVKYLNTWPKAMINEEWFRLMDKN